jgi:hypothetical protein
MLMFDATGRETCTARRELTTTPLQALVFLNDPQYVEASRVLAQSLIEHHNGAINARWDELFRRVISRLPSGRERDVVNQLYSEQLKYFQADPGQADEFLTVGTRSVDDAIDRSDLAATTIVVQTLFGYDETIMLR